MRIEYNSKEDQYEVFDENISTQTLCTVSKSAFGIYAVDVLDTIATFLLTDYGVLLDRENSVSLNLKNYDKLEKLLMERRQ